MAIGGIISVGVLGGWLTPEGASVCAAILSTRSVLVRSELQAVIRNIPTIIATGKRRKKIDITD